MPVKRADANSRKRVRRRLSGATRRQLITKLVQPDFGISIVPRVAVRNEVARGLLHAIPVFRRKEARRLGAIYLKRAHLPPAAVAFLAVLEDTLRSGVA